MKLLSALGGESGGSCGEIIFDSPSPAVECQVSNLTVFGATLVLPAATVVPDEIMLAIAGEFVMRRCRVLWRRPSHIGVSFVLPA